jgi:hypothetical protein
LTLALGLAATFIGAAFVIAGYSDRSLGRLLFGYWDAPGTSKTAASGKTTSAPGAIGKNIPGENLPGNALNGGVHAPTIIGQRSNLGTS